ncbi:hypothetical protein ACQ4PT_028028 [Festuca glaucescens]
MAPIRRAAQRPDFASHPSDLELINTYLIPWVNTGERPWKFIHDADVYAARPADLASNFAPATASDGLEGWYFFSTLRSKNRRGQRKSRTVGSGDDGCWHSERAAKPLFAGIAHSRQIGYRQTFSFATKGDGRLVRSGWLMAEIGLNTDGSEEDELVLCKVYRSPRVGPAKRSTAVATEAGPRVGRGKASERSAPSQQGRAGPAHLPSCSSDQPARVSASSSGTVSMESDSEQDSTSQGVIGTSPSATPPRRPIPRVIAGDTARNPRPEALRAPQIPFLPSSPIRRTSAAPGAVAAARPDFACHPSDQALVQSYLIPHIASGQHPCKFTHDADVYAAGPDALTSQFPPAMSSDGEKAWYIFTTLPAKSTHGQRRPRTVATGEGCWHSEAGVKPVVDGDHQIGWRQFFSFMTKEAGQRVRNTRTGWIMVEIGLEQEGLTDELVLCKVYRSPRKGPAPSALESTAAAAASGRKRKAGDNNSGAVTPALTLGTAPGAKKSTAAAAPCGPKRKTGDSNSGARGPARGVLKLTTPPTSGRKKQGDKKKTSAPRLCTRCRIETAESDSGATEDDDTEDDETRGGSETGLLEHDSMTDESAAPHGHEAGDSSASARTFYRFV